MEQDFVSLIGSLGFPIVVAMYLIIKMDKTLQSLSKTITDFSQTNREVLNELARQRKDRD